MGWLVLTGSVKGNSHEDFLDALQQVESSGSLNPPDGDNGKAIGPFQIHVAYWKDACEADKALRRDYQACRDYAYSRAVVIAYFARYAPKAWTKKDWETLARIHNGGLRGANKAATVGYWKKVQQIMDLEK